MTEYTERQIAIMDTIAVMVVAVVTSGDGVEQAMRDAADHLLESCNLTTGDLLKYKSKNQE